uniref:CLIP domain-containing serine protease n=1 Tax=Rhodnius prolixus TaxID=13249 RepID=B8QQQ1_RHOPR|nr:serine proteinase [Rhodnius prolixus]
MINQLSLVLLLVGLVCFGNCLNRTTRQVSFESSSSCTTLEGDNGRCINVRQCPPLLDLLRNSRHKPGVADYLKKTVCGYDRNDPLVCCPNQPDFQPSIFGSGRRTTEGTSPLIDNRDTLPSPPQCGKSSVQKIRIVGGQPSDLGAWPWLAVLGYRSNRNPTTQWLCGGALVTSRHIVTAAHCTRHPSLSLFKVRLGELDLDNNVNDGANPIDVNIERTIVHPSYNPQKYTDDIAVLKLQNEVPFSRNIQPICLPTTSELREMSLTKKFPFVAGWGSVQFKGPSLTALQEVQVPVVENEECRRAYKAKGADIISRQLCAGFALGGKDACQGDSGGPLMLPHAGSYYLIGVVSYGFRCAEAGFPGIYSRVTSLFKLDRTKLEMIF